MNALAGTVPPPPTPSLSGGWALRPADPVTDLARVHAWLSASGDTRSREGLQHELRTKAAGRATRPGIVSRDDVPVIYLELHRVLHHVLRTCYPVGSHDLVLDLVTGSRGPAERGLVASLLPELASALFTADPACRRITAAPDADDTVAVQEFQNGGFRHVTEVDLPDRTVALLVAERPEITRISTALDDMPH
ncbi:GNAT family N-acetyltransferase [Streptomyces carpinensis]|uniref:GNAT family N-acetyltransferase n=1 Tax=Streptomyces carpinensis TaxID=66369 RepID=A0ABV1VYL7_9ACTN|nr:GNAT family N-acetyltransferase [Streptomyces carpinensis]